MSKQLYEEALADVKKLKEVAEDNAKRALLEAVTPRIRDLIENQLLGESYAEEIEADKDKLLMDEPASQVEVPTPVEPSPHVGDANASASAISLPDEEGKVTLDLAALKVPGDDEYELSMESAAALGLLVKSDGVPTEDPRRRIESLGEKVNLFTSAGRLVSESEGYLTALAEIISEVEDVYGFIQNDLKESEDKNAYEAVLEGHYATLKQLMEQKMNKGKKELAEADVTLKLTGMPDDIDLDSIGVDLVSDDEAPAAAEDAAEEEDEEAEETEEEAADEDLDLEEEGDDKKMESTSLSDDTIVEIDEGMLRREIARMKSLREADETAPQSWGNGPGDVSDEFEDEDLGDPFVDVELTTEGEDDDKKESDDKKMDEYGMDEDDDKKAEEAQDKKVDELEELDMDQAEDDRERGGNVAPDSMGPGAKTNKQLRHTESLKNRLEAEVHIQTEAKKKAQAAKKKQLEAQKKMKQAKKVQEKEQAKKQAKKMQEAYAFYATKFNESVARSNKLKGMLNEATRKDGAALNGGTKRSDAETDNLRTKLAETNLFNAKLLFTNKLLQLESLTKRQKAEVIERLDEAKSEREVKLVYESLVKALQGAPAKLAESTDRGVIGSSSRPARQSSASNSLNEGVEADRWARLAGIVK